MKRKVFEENIFIKIKKKKENKYFYVKYSFLNPKFYNQKVTVRKVVKYKPTIEDESFLEGRL